jgi:hypothetical protein
MRHHYGCWLFNRGRLSSSPMSSISESTSGPNSAKVQTHACPRNLERCLEIRSTEDFTGSVAIIQMLTCSVDSVKQLRKQTSASTPRPITSVPSSRSRKTSNCWRESGSVDMDESTRHFAQWPRHARGQASPCQVWYMGSRAYILRCHCLDLCPLAYRIRTYQELFSSIATYMKCNIHEIYR